MASVPKTNEYFKALQKLKEYKSLEKRITRALEEQWEDVIMSGIVNTFFTKYKKFFVRKKGKKVKIKKSFIKADVNNNGIDDEVETQEELEQQSDKKLLNNKLIVDGEALDMVALLVFLNIEVDKNLYSFGSYYKTNKEFKKYLKFIADKTGMDLFASLNLSKPVVFKLTKKEYLEKISKRVNDLVKGVNKDMKKKLADKLAVGLRNNETKALMMKRLQKLGPQISAAKAKLILDTETHAMNQYIKYEIAKLNGVATKRWVTFGDERVCPTCSGMSGSEVKMEGNFKHEIEGATFSGLLPPAHPLCRCDVEYQFNMDAYFDFMKAKKKKEQYIFYTTTDTSVLPIFNPEAIWAGGEKLVGKDRAVADYYVELMDLSRDKMLDSIKITDGKMALDDPLFYPFHNEGRILKEARKKLTDNGFIQLLLSLGIRQKIISKENI